MALPPCHLLCQFYVNLPSEDNPHQKPKLSCLMFQRSADLGLGIPFNIASYALLTHMIAQVTGTEAHELIIQLGDAHVYRDHIEALETQLKREPKPFPKLKWAREGISDIEAFEYSDFEVEGYDPHPTIPMKMSV
jgi:thymidylate synthase